MGGARIPGKRAPTSRSKHEHVVGLYIVTRAYRRYVLGSDVCQSHVLFYFMIIFQMTCRHMFCFMVCPVRLCVFLGIFWMVVIYVNLCCCHFVLKPDVAKTVVVTHG